MGLVASSSSGQPTSSPTQLNNNALLCERKTVKPPPPPPTTTGESPTDDATHGLVEIAVAHSRDGGGESRTEIRIGKHKVKEECSAQRVLLLHVYVCL